MGDDEMSALKSGLPSESIRLADIVGDAAKTVKPDDYNLSFGMTVARLAFEAGKRDVPDDPIADLRAVVAIEAVSLRYDGARWTLTWIGRPRYGAAEQHTISGDSVPECVGRAVLLEESNPKRAQVSP
jgi:hypothetical protein